MVKQLIDDGFKFELVVADCLYGESTDFIEAMARLGLKFVVAIRRNHGVWMGPGQRIGYTTWHPFARRFSNGDTEVRYIREIIFGKRTSMRYYHVTTDPATLPTDTTQLLMTNMTDTVQDELGNLYGMRTWIEYGFKQTKNELGWADYRLTAYHDIERWWEVVCTAYLLVSLQTPLFRELDAPKPARDAQRCSQHRWWDAGHGWKNVLNNVRLLLQPYFACCVLTPWVTIFELPHVRNSLYELVRAMDTLATHLLL